MKKRQADRNIRRPKGGGLWASSTARRRNAFRLLGITITILTLGSIVVLVSSHRSDSLYTAADVSRLSDWASEAVLRLYEPTNSETQGPVQVILRDNGRRLAGVWADGNDWGQSLRRAATEAFGQVENDAQVDTIEINLTHSYRSIDGDSGHGAFDNMHRGIHGVEVSGRGHRARLSPTEMISFNLTFARGIERLRELCELQPDEVAEIYIFDSFQSLITLDRQLKGTLIPIVRGNELVAIEEINKENIHTAASLMAIWLVRNVDATGRMTYKYWPSNGNESTSNNLIRQFMATIALGRWANHTSNQRIRFLRDRNLEFNMRSFYKVHEDIGYVEYEEDEGVKLGAVALAALALVERSDTTETAGELAAMLRFIDRMQNPNGQFHTWYPRQPLGADAGVNFYPGEALLLWATIYTAKPDPVLLDKIMTSFNYYRSWHRRNRNPAFIPWHTQAYFLVWNRTRNAELADFIFEMNDWLVKFQQWDSAPYPDMKGRFYDPAQPHFGPPHSASTGVYLEGLVDAFKLAKALGDDNRAKVYRETILRGVRNILQLQFKDNVDMFYISRKDAVRGGVRTTEYNNEIRVDNVQHNLVAMMKLFEAFDDHDYMWID